MKITINRSHELLFENLKIGDVFAAKDDGEIEYYIKIASSTASFNALNLSVNGLKKFSPSAYVRLVDAEMIIND